MLSTSYYGSNLESFPKIFMCSKLELLEGNYIGGTVANLLLEGGPGLRCVTGSVTKSVYSCP